MMNASASLRRGRKTNQGASCKAALVMSLAGILLSGCALFDDEGPYRFSEGWREGTVRRYGTRDLFAGDSHASCTQLLDAPDADASLFALLSYRSFSHVRSRLVRVDRSINLKAGDIVHFPLSNCESPVGLEAPQP